MPGGTQGEVEVIRAIPTSSNEGLVAVASTISCSEQDGRKEKIRSTCASITLAIWGLKIITNASNGASKGDGGPVV